MEEEKESLRRQIQLLQGLINSHKIIHGNAPAPPPAANPRWQPPAQPREVFRGRGYQQPLPNQSVWRKKYSLVNRTTQGADASAASSGEKNAPKIPAAMDVSQKLGRPKLSLNKDKPSEVSTFKWQSATTQESRVRPKPPANAAVPSTSVLRGARTTDSGSHAPATLPGTRKEILRGAAKTDHVSWTSLNRTSPAQVAAGAQPPFKKPHVSIPKTEVNCSPLKPSAGALHRTPQNHINTRTTPNNLNTRTPQNHINTRTTQNNLSTRTPQNNLSTRTTQNDINSRTTQINLSTRTTQNNLSTRTPQNNLNITTAIKATKCGRTKYSWVSDSPKAPAAAKRVSPSAKKILSDEKQKTPEATARARKNGANPKAMALRSRYKWKAENVLSSREAVLTPNRSSAVGAQRSGPVTPQHRKEPAVMAAAASYRELAQSTYKVKSKTKIIRRRSTSRSPAEKKSSPLAPLMVRSHYFLRRRIPSRVKSPITVKRSSPRGLVHISKHRLRRLPPPGKQQPPAIREASSSSSLKSPPASRVIKTRYRIVKRSGTPPLVTSPLSTLSLSLTWRTRLLLLNRLRQNQNQQRWRSRGLCVIGGAMYRVSANKLSKTWSPGTGSKATPKSGKLDVGSTSPGSLYPSRSATPSRYIASRAIQRSLAIIRQAPKKKEKKEYCMYYNRFGKCNRGQKCPYIHDPEKVAVCTRFLRGTCKKTDGTCPFSHQVSKDKMPVCSYFLKGICHNNDCPYSHVYVSRKAEVCQDFLKGYCPMGAKCKKKHTLLCPDYARDGKCPQGAKCKLQHRQRKRRVDVTAPPEQMPTSAKQKRKTPDQTGTSPVTARVRDDPSTSDEELPGSSGLLSCPSFISLNCSSASDGTPVSEKVKSSENSGKPLQIKPRL